MLKLCIFADIHYMDEIPSWPNKRKLVEYAKPLTEKMVKKINNDINPDIVIHLGDLIQSTNDIDKDKNNLIYIWSILKEIKYPYYTIVGNHELKSVKSNKEIMDIIDYENATFSLNIDDYHLVFIGTDINEEDKIYRTQYISENDMQWLKNDLEINKNKNIIIFSHFGIAEDRDIKENFWCYSDDGENLMLRNRKELKEIMKGKNIIGVFCGHQHWTKTIHENGFDYYMIGSLTENINNDGIPDGVYFEVILNNNELNVIKKHLSIELDN